MANTGRAQKSIKRGAGKRRVDGQSFRLADEVRYITRRAAHHDGRIVRSANSRCSQAKPAMPG